MQKEFFNEKSVVLEFQKSFERMDTEDRRLQQKLKRVVLNERVNRSQERHPVEKVRRKTRLVRDAMQYFHHNRRAYQEELRGRLKGIVEKRKPRPR